MDEIRNIEGLTLETREGKTMPVITGVPICFDKRSDDLGGFVEIVKPEAVTLGQRDVLALAHHDTAQVLGRQSSGTLTLTKDDTGIRMELAPPDTTVGRDIIESVRRGDIKGMSFGFRTRKDRWTFSAQDSKEPDLRELLDIDLREVSIVAFPAYPDTSVAVRSLEQARAQIIPPAPVVVFDNRKHRQTIAEITAKF